MLRVVGAATAVTCTPRLALATLELLAKISRVLVIADTAVDVSAMMSATTTIDPAVTLRTMEVGDTSTALARLALKPSWSKLCRVAAIVKVEEMRVATAWPGRPGGSGLGGGDGSGACGRGGGGGDGSGLGGGAEGGGGVKGGGRKGGGGAYGASGGELGG